MGKWTGRIVADRADSDLLKLFAAADFPAPDFPGEVKVTASNIGGTYRVRMPDAQGEAVFYAKYFTAPSWLDSLKTLVAPSPAARSWQAAWTTLAAGVPTPRPVALMELKSRGLVAKSVFINEAVPYACDENLEMYFRHNFDLAPLTSSQILEKRAIIKLIGQMFQKAHAQDQIYFPDFHPHNMVLQKAPGEPIRLYLVDFDEVRFVVRRDDRMKNLSSLGRNADKIIKRMERPAITTGDRLRFIKAYLGPGQDDPEATERLKAEIVKNWNLK